MIPAARKFDGQMVRHYSCVPWHVPWFDHPLTLADRLARGARIISDCDTQCATNTAIKTIMDVMAGTEYWPNFEGRTYGWDPSG